MASPNVYPSGLNLAGTVFQNGPATLQLDGETYLSGTVQWVDTIGGSNLNTGFLPELPVATFAQAVTNSSPNGVIVVGEGSSESIAVSQSIGLAGLSIFGCGIGSSRPRYTCTGAVDMWTLDASGIWIEGFYMPASTAASTSRISVLAAQCVVKDVYMECGANDTSRSLRIHTNGETTWVRDCSFVVTASRPAIGLQVSAAVDAVCIEGCTFDGGSYGWSDYALKVTAAAGRMRRIGNTFINRSDSGHTVTGTSYQIFGNNTGGTGNVLLTA